LKENNKAKSLDKENVRIILGLIFISVISMIVGAFITSIRYEKIISQCKSEIKSLKTYQDLFCEMFDENTELRVKEQVLIQFIKFYFRESGFGNVSAVMYIKPEKIFTEHTKGTYGIIVKAEKGCIVFVYYFDGEKIYDETLILSGGET